MRDRDREKLSALQESIAGVRVIQAYGREDERDPAASPAEPGALPAPTCSPCGCRPGTSGSWSGWASPHRASRWCGRWPAGPTGHGVRRDGRGVRPAAHEPVRTRLAALPAVQQLPVVRRRRSTSCSACSTRSPTSRSGPAPWTCPTVGVVELEGVSSSTGRRRRPVLRDVRLRIEAGERLALVGPTGAGKSTLAKLVARLYDPTVGEVPSGGSTSATRRWPRCGSASSSSPRRVSSSTARSATTSGWPGPRRSERTSTPRSDRRRAGPLHRPARRPGHGGARARHPAVGRRASARVHGPRRAGRPGRARPGRGDVEPRPGHRSHWWRRPWRR